MSLVDTHCHLDDQKFDADREAAIERALQAGVTRMMAVGTGNGPPDLEAGVRLADRYDFMYATVGIHPHDASKATEESFARLAELTSHPKVLAIGEIGLDYHYDLSPRDVQRQVFTRQLEIAAESGKPIVIHTREAWDDTMAALSNAGLPVRGIMHCFTGDEAQAREALGIGLHLAFGGVLTFPNAEAVRQAARITPEDRLLLETDCPYLAPVPHRGKRNEPAFAVDVARRLAEVRACALSDIEQATTRNFDRLCLRGSAGYLVNWLHHMNLGKAGQAFTAREIFDLIQPDLERVEIRIAAESVASAEAVTAIGHYLQSAGGKRLRPALLLLSARVVDGLAPAAAETAIQLGAVVELIHAATLVHDDVIDAAQTRRGRPSTNARWGNHTCVLAGDWLYMQAFQIALRERSFQFLDQLIGLTQMMVEGELLQLERIGRIDVTEADCMELVDRKTARLFSVCARLGAMAGKASAADQEKLGEYGWNLGMAFQLVDDMLDFTAREKTLGKPVGGDLREGKVTLPLVYALERATAEERRLIGTVLKQRSYETVPFSRILEILGKYGGIERVRARARSFTEKARLIVSEFPESPCQRALVAVTSLVTERDH